MAVVMVISFLMLFFHGGDEGRNRIGERFIEGYTHDSSEFDFDEEGHPYDRWTANNRTGRWVLDAFELALLVAVFALPVATHKAASVAYYKKEGEFPVTADGWRVESYKSRV